MNNIPIDTAYLIPAVKSTTKNHTRLETAVFSAEGRSSLSGAIPKRRNYNDY